MHIINSIQLDSVTHDHRSHNLTLKNADQRAYNMHRVELLQRVEDKITAAETQSVGLELGTHLR